MGNAATSRRKNQSINHSNSCLCQRKGGGCKGYLYTRAQPRRQAVVHTAFTRIRTAERYVALCCVPPAPCCCTLRCSVSAYPAYTTSAAVTVKNTQGSKNLNLARSNTPTHDAGSVTDGNTSCEGMDDVKAYECKQDMHGCGYAVRWAGQDAYKSTAGGGGLQRVGMRAADVPRTAPLQIAHAFSHPSTPCVVLPYRPLKNREYRILLSARCPRPDSLPAP